MSDQRGPWEHESDAARRILAEQPDRTEVIPPIPSPPTAQHWQHQFMGPAGDRHMVLPPDSQRLHRVQLTPAIGLFWPIFGGILAALLVYTLIMFVLFAALISGNQGTGL